MIMSEIKLSCRQHFWIVFCNNIIQSVNQLWLSERDVRGAFLKVFNSEHFIFIALFTLNRSDVIIQTKGDVFPVIGIGLPLNRCSILSRSASRLACGPLFR